MNRRRRLEEYRKKPESKPEPKPEQQPIPEPQPKPEPEPKPEPKKNIFGTRRFKFADKEKAEKYAKDNGGKVIEAKSKLGKKFLIVSIINTTK